MSGFAERRYGRLPRTVEEVEARMRQAAATLWMMPGGSPRPAGYRSAMPTPVDAGGGRQSVTMHEIGAMEEALGWLRLLPADRPDLRIVVCLRTRHDPARSTPTAWRAVALSRGEDARAVRRKYDLALRLILGALAASR